MFVLFCRTSTSFSGTFGSFSPASIHPPQTIKNAEARSFLVKKLPASAPLRAIKQPLIPEFRPKVVGDDLPRAVGHLLQTLGRRVQALDGNLLVDDHFQPVAVQIERAARKDMERAVQRNRDDGQVLVRRHLERTPLEAAHLARLRARPFGENRHRSAAPEALFRLAHRTSRRLRRGIIDKDKARRPASRPHKRDPLEARLHDPLDRRPQETVYQKDVERTLMIGGKDVRLPFPDMLPAPHLHRA